MFAELTKVGGATIAIAKDKVVQVSVPNTNGTAILLSTGATVTVTESYTDVLTALA